jgi:hypothetical protein
LLAPDFSNQENSSTLSIGIDVLKTGLFHRKAIGRYGDEKIS